MASLLYVLMTRWQMLQWFAVKLNFFVISFLTFEYAYLILHDYKIYQRSVQVALLSVLRTSSNRLLLYVVQRTERVISLFIHSIAIFALTQ